MNLCLVVNHHHHSDHQDPHFFLLGDLHARPAAVELSEVLKRNSRRYCTAATAAGAKCEIVKRDADEMPKLIYLKECFGWGWGGGEEGDAKQ